MGCVLTADGRNKRWQEGDLKHPDRDPEQALRPAYKETVKEKHDDPVDAMTRIHVKQTSAVLRPNRDLGPLLKKGSLAVVSTYYSLDSGWVEVLTGAPSPVT
ncbi:hypothetical protein ACFYMI_25935 [Streptomyces collinus]|uniref:hypothetical protein n=1 Tax=Streptomyces collinus TaxID=42684 RepID=UPI00367CF4B7